MSEGAINFILRDIPPNLHTDWKILAIAKGMSMKDYILFALAEQTKKDQNLILKGGLKLNGFQQDNIGKKH